MTGSVLALRASFVAACVAMAVVILTPVGVWLAAGGVSLYAGTQDWDLQIRRHEGSLATSLYLGNVTVIHAASGVDADIAEVVFDPWAWEVNLVGPRVRLTPPAEPASPDSAQTPTEPLRLPLDDLPAVTIVDGAFRLHMQDQGTEDLIVELTDVGARLSHDGAAAGSQLELELGAWRVEQGETQLHGEARTRWRLQPSTVALTQGFARVMSDEGQGTFRGTAQLDLTPGLDLVSSFTVEGALGSGDAVVFDEMWMDATVAGALNPIDIRITSHGEARHVDLGPLALQLSGTIDSTAVQADTVRLEIAEGRVDGRFSWFAAQDTVQGEARIEGMSLQTLTAGALAGPLHGTLQLSGALMNPRVVLGLQAPTVEGLAELPLDLVINAGLQEQQLQARISSRSLGHLVASGRVDLATPTYDLALSGALDTKPWSGRSWRLGVRGQLRPDTLSAAFTAPQLPFGDDPPGPVQIDATLAAWRHLDVRVAVAGSQFTGRARMDLQTANVDTLTGTARGLPLASLSKVVQGQLSGRLNAAGALPAQGSGAMRLLVDDLAIADWSLGPTSLSTSFTAGVAAITANARGFNVQASVDTAGTASIRLDLLDAVVRQQVTGDSVHASGVVTGVGNLHDLVSGILDINLDSLGASVGGLSVAAPAGVRAQADGGRMRLELTRLVTPVGALRLQGMVAADSMLITVTLDTVKLTESEDLAAQGSASLHISGRPDDPRAQLRLALASLHLGSRSLGELVLTAGLSDSLRGSLQLGASNGTPAPLHVQMSAPASLLHLGAGPGEEDRARLHIVARDLDASSLATWVFDDTTGLTASLVARIEVPASRLLEGVGWREVSAEVELQDLTLTRDRVRLRLEKASRAQLADGRGSMENFVLPVEMFQRDTNTFDEAGIISINGTLTGDGGGLELKVSELDLLAAARAVPGRLSLPAGQLSLQANLTGSFDEPALNATANVELEDLGSLGARVAGRPRAWKGSATWVTLVEDSLQVTGSAPAVNIWPKWEELTLRAHSTGIDLLPLLDQVPQLESLGGFVRMDVTADSLSTNPRFTGQVEMEDLEFALLDVNPGYRFGPGRIDFGAREGGGAHAELSGFSGQTTRGSGVLQLSGFFDLLPGGDTDYNIRLTGDNVSYEYDDIFTAPDIDMDLTLRRGDQGSLLEGKVALTRPSTDIQLVDLTAPPVPPPPTVQDELLENTRLNVYVDIDGLVTRSELSDITLDGQARVYGTFYQPRFQGEMEIVDGQVIILSRRFTFTRGRIILDRLVPTYSILDLLYDPILLDPELDIEATTSVKTNSNSIDATYEVTLNLSGPARSATPRLTSPGLGDGEVLSLLAFGQTTTQNADYAGAFYTAAGQLLLGRQVQKVGLDEFLLLPSGTALGTVGEPSVRIGKYLSWPVPIWVRYEAITNNAASGQLEVEYRITNWMTLDATAHSEYELYGLGIGLSREF